MGKSFIIKEWGLRIVSWNCHYGFDKEKQDAVMTAYEDADILVIQECREIDSQQDDFLWNRADWYGDHREAKDTFGNINADKDLGIGIFCKEGIEIKRGSNNPEFRYVVPYIVTGRGTPFTLIAVWTKGGYADYHIPVYKAADSYVFDTPIILLGDFNTGSIKDYDSKKWYNNLKTKLENGQSFGKPLLNCAKEQEWENTYFKGNGKWLDDHCFASKDFFDKLDGFKIGEHEKWIKPELSDHCPIIVHFGI
jgi:endonuclease/exonuclease/phosphatase family metal-dependent hydrolase